MPVANRSVMGWNRDALGYHVDGLDDTDDHRGRNPQPRSDRFESNPAPVPITAGPFDGMVRWDIELASYVAELQLFPAREADAAPGCRSAGSELAGVAGVGGPGSPFSARRRHAIREASYLWCFEAFDSYLPTDLIVGHRPAEFVTIDAMANHLAIQGLELSPSSRHRLAEMRHLVEDRWGDAVIVGRMTQARSANDGALIDRERFRLWVELPSGHTVDLVPRRADIGYAFDCGAPTPGTLQTARAIVELAWSTSWGSREELLATELAVGFLFSARSGFELLAGSVADWIVTDVPLRFRSEASTRNTTAPSARFRQLALGFG